MTKLIEPFLCWWVGFVQNNPRKMIISLFILSIFSVIYSVNNFAVDSDLDQMIRQDNKSDWYVNSVDFWKSFPDYHRNIIVVVSGKSAYDTYLNAQKLYFVLRDSHKFDDVFAPVFEDFVQDHVFYNIPTEGVKRLSAKVQESIPALAKVYHQPDINELLHYLQQQYLTAADMQVLMPDVRYQLSTFEQTLNQLEHNQSAHFRLVQPLVPPDDGKMAYQLIIVKRAPQFGAELPNKQLVDDLHHLIKTSNLSADVDVRLTGEIALMHDEISESLKGFNLAGQISIVLLLIFLGIGIRSKVLLLGMFIQLGMGVLFSAVFTLAVYGSFNTLSLVFVIMLFGLGVDFAVHFTLRQLEVMRTEPDVKKAGLITVRDAGIPIGICALTTAISFAAFSPTEYVGLAQLGIISAFGMLAAYFLSLTFIPAWMVVFKIQPPALKTKAPVEAESQDAKHFEYPAKTVLCVVGILFCASVWYVHDTRFNYNLLSMHNQKTETIVTLKELQKNHLINPYALSALVDKSTDLEALKEKLLALPTVAAVQIPKEHLPMFQDMKQQYMQKVANDLAGLGTEGAATYDAQKTQQSLEQFLALLEQHKDEFVDEDLALVEQLAAKLKQVLAEPNKWPVLQKAISAGIKADVVQLNTWFSAKPYQIDDMPDYIKRRLVSPDGRYLVQVLPNVDMSNTSENRRFIHDVMKVIPDVTGLPVYEFGVGQLVVHSFYIAISLAVVLIFAVMAITFRNAFSAVFIFIPMVLVVVFTLAVAKMIGMTMNMANVLVIPLIFGLGVDTGIHVLHRYHLSANIKETLFSSTGKAAILSALTTISSFIAIAFSEHKGAASIGILLTVALTLIVAVTFIVLPALLMLFDPKKKTGKRIR